MSIEITIASILAVASVGYAVFVLLRVRAAHCFTRKQKLLQSLIVVCIPLFGAWFVHAMYRSDDELPVQEDKNHIPLDTGHS